MGEAGTMKRIKRETGELLRVCGFKWLPWRQGWEKAEDAAFLDFETVRDLEDRDAEALRVLVQRGGVPNPEEERVIALLLELQSVPVAELLSRVRMGEAELRGVLRRIELQRIGYFSRDVVNDDVECFSLSQK